VNLLKEGIDCCTTSPIETIFDLLTSLAKFNLLKFRTENFYQGVFEYIEATLKAETIVCKENFDIDLIKTIIEHTNNPELVKAVYTNDKLMISYR
jgi:hypothetical protein